MQSRWARRVVLALVLVFPIAITATSARPSAGAARGLRASLPIVAVEMVLVGGMVFAARERSRLLVEMEAVRTRPRRVASLSGPKAVAKHFVFGSAKNSV